MESTFFWEDYLLLNTDIINHNNEKGALNHYQNHGKNEKRLTKFPDNSNFFFIYNFEQQKTNFKKQIYDTYGIEIGTIEKKTNKEETKDFFYLCNKFKITSEKYKNILYFVLYGISFKNNLNSNQNLNLVISHYNEKDNNRIFELLLVFALNLQNNNISKIHLLFENNHPKTPNLLRTVINVLLIRNKLYDRIKINNIKEKPSFSSIFNYVNKLPNNTNVIVSNSDILFDNTLEPVCKNLREDHFICLSRYNWIKSPKSWELINMEFNDKKYSNVFSQDAWIFKTPMKFPIAIDINLGDMFSDSYLNYKLKNTTNYSCFNLSKSIRVHHVQEANSYSDLVKDNPNLMNELLEKIRKKEGGQTDILYGIYYSTLNEWNDANKNKFVSNFYFQQHTSEFLC